jgi:hypothetical protein
MTPSAEPWDPVAAQAQIRACLAQCAAWWHALDVFERPSLRRPEIVAARAAVDAAFRAQDRAALTAALEAYQLALQDAMLALVEATP